MSVKSSNTFARTNAARRAGWTLLGAATLALLGANVYADNAYDAPATKVVSYKDLNLADASGAQMLYSRLQGAAKQVCSGLNGKDLRRVELYRDCYEETLATAVASVDQAKVTALFRADRTIRLAQSPERNASRS